DLAGYTADRPLHELRLLEPCVGDGDFLLPVIDRLFDSLRRAGLAPPLDRLAAALCAVELHGETFRSTRAKVIDRLTGHGLSPRDARFLADAWLRQGDFLLLDIPQPFDVVAGNPPYVRQELVPDVLIAEYRARYATIFDRADLYIPFIERSLSLLAPD